MSPLVAALEAESSSAGHWPYLVGGGIFLVLLIALLILVSVGGGREHS